MIRALLAALALLAVGCVPVNQPGTLSVAPGRTNVAGCITTPTLTCVFEHLRPGDTLAVRGGDYHEIVKTATLAQASRSAPITVYAPGGERPVIHGMLWLAYPTWWTVDGLNVTWAAGNPDEHMVNIYGGDHWTFEHAELWGAHSYADLLIGDGRRADLGTATVTGNCIHDTAPTNDVNQDHNIYVDDENSPAPHVIISRNLLYGAPNGMNVKVGPADTGGPHGVRIDHNTMYDAYRNVSVSKAAHDNLITNNLLVRASSGYNVEGYKLTGANDRATGNYGAESNATIHAGTGIVDGGGNVHGSASFDALSCAGFHPQGAAARYGRYAP